MKITPRPQTRGQRKKLRQDIRNNLGVSHDDAPTAQQLLRVASALDALLSLTTSGRYRLLVARGGDTMPPRHFFNEVREIGYDDL